MNRKIIGLGAAAALLFAMSASSVASAANTKGPYNGASPDSGTCGNNWANDTFKRKFTTTNNGDGTYALREDFIAGKFVTIAGSSPNACNVLPGPAGNGHVVTAGINGEFNGFLSGTVSGGTYNPAGSCANDPCTTTGYVAGFFGPTATYTCLTGIGACSFDFDYHANGAGKLLYSRWQNASPDQGGNQGDIATS